MILVEQILRDPGHLGSRDWTKKRNISKQLKKFHIMKNKTLVVMGLRVDKEVI